MSCKELENPNFCLMVISASLTVQREAICLDGERN
jgi:hypothetical protein